MDSNRICVKRSARDLYDTNLASAFCWSRNPTLIRRQRLIERLEEQKRLSTDPTFTPISKRWKKSTDGSKALVDHYRRLKPWWRVDGNGNVILTVKTGFKVLEFQKGKPGIAFGSVEGLGAVFDTLKAATAAGELDGLLASATDVEDRAAVEGKKTV